MKAMTALLPDIMAAANLQPDPKAQAKADASASVREQKAITPQPNTELRPSNSRRDFNPQDKRQDR